MDGILRSDLYLMEDYLPKELPHREKELEEIASAIKPMFYNRKPIQLVLTGPPGVGKTSCAKYILKELEDNTNVNTAYINCWTYNTRASIYAKILLEFGIAVPRQGVPTDSLFETLVEFFKKEHKAVLVLDEIDQISEMKPLYELNLICSWFPHSLAILIISYRKETLKRLNRRTKSRFQPRVLEFKPYSKEELLDILAERVKLAFKPGSVEPEALELIAEEALKRGGDARAAIELLLEAGKEADFKGSKLTTSIVKLILSL